MSDAGDTDKIVCIDGEAGTTGRQIRERLAHVAGIHVNSIDPAQRKDAGARREMMRDADLVVLCLPDDAAREAVALADELGSKSPKIIDASTAHRTAEGWVYGFAELDKGQSRLIANATRVANPGCYATGAIAIIRPLVEAGVVAPGFSITINAVSGYTGGGKSMIASYKSGEGAAFELYGLELDHKHIPEIIAHAGLSQRPIFVPSVGAFEQGMLVSVPLQLELLGTSVMVAKLDEVYGSYYSNVGGQVRYHTRAEDGVIETSRLRVDPAAGTDTMELWVLGNNGAHQAVVVARLDNLGKGAAGAAVQNIKLMLGLD